MEKEKNYFTGIIGGIIGGLIATLPWILMYVYGNMILSLLAIVVAIGVLKDYIISVIFTFLGISGVVANVKKQLEEGKTENIKASIENSIGVTQNKENIETVRNAFLKYNATTKENAVEKEKILKEIALPNTKGLFNNLRMQQIITKTKGKYYFNETYANSMGKRFLKLYLKILGIILLFVLFIIFLAI